MNVCRTCVSSTSNELVPIFSKLDDQFIANVIVDCSSVMVRIKISFLHQINYFLYARLWKTTTCRRTFASIASREYK